MLGAEEVPHSPRVHCLPGTELAPSPEAGARQVTNRALGPEGGGAARKWQSRDTRPELSDFEPLHSPCHPGGFVEAAGAGQTLGRGPHCLW